ncbi:MAG: recombination protein RecR [Verrucomicrobia bacterium]|nr:recombination protein RecR [Verrucomicrobiota bacterium]
MQNIQYPKPIEDLIRQLRRMPGVGPRSAERIGLWMIQKKEAKAQEIAEAVIRAVREVGVCERCGFFAESTQCAICSDPGRDSRLVCVVEQPTDILPVERTAMFRGLYHTLGGRLSPLDHIGPENLRIGALLGRVREEKPEEIILALSGDVEGEATANYIGDLLEQEGARTTRIAQGLPAGLSLESADELTLLRALRGRTAFHRSNS